jgi:hypothetical protein
MALIKEATLQDSIQQIERINLEKELITPISENFILILEDSIDNNQQEDGVDQYIRYSMGGQIGARISRFPAFSISI